MKQTIEIGSTGLNGGGGGGNVSSKEAKALDYDKKKFDKYVNLVDKFKHDSEKI